MGKAVLAPAVAPDAFFAGRPLARAVFDAVRDRLAAIRPVEVRVSRRQVAFRGWLAAVPVSRGRG